METLQKKVGDTLEVVLDERGGSGLSMKYKIDNEELVSIEGPETLSRGQMKPGDAVKVKYTIHFLKPGSTKILFYETQVWNKNFPPLPAKELLVDIS